MVSEWESTKEKKKKRRGEWSGPTLPDRQKHPSTPVPSSPFPLPGPPFGRLVPHALASPHPSGVVPVQKECGWSFVSNGMSRSHARHGHGPHQSLVIKDVVPPAADHKTAAQIRTRTRRTFLADRTGEKKRAVEGGHTRRKKGIRFAFRTSPSGSACRPGGHRVSASIFPFPPVSIVGGPVAAMARQLRMVRLSLPAKQNGTGRKAVIG